MKGCANILEAVLSNPVAHHIYLREILEPTWADYEEPSDAAKIWDFDNYDDSM